MKQFILGHKAILGLGLTTVGTGTLIVGLITGLSIVALGVCAVISGNQITVYDRITRSHRLVAGAGRETWEDGFDFGKHHERRVRSVVVPFGRRGEDPQRRFLSS